MLEYLPDLTQPAGWLPLAFLAMMALAMLAYVVLDGYDLGVGLLLEGASDREKDVMISSIGPFWDANETWLVMGVGILLVAFPIAHGVILGALYLPVSLMLIGLILRGVAFDFRVKARDSHKGLWNHAFFGGSLLASLSQGYMVGMFVVGFQAGAWPVLFSLFIGLCVAAAYALLGAGWLLMKTEGALQRKAVAWARGSLVLTAVGLAAISLVTPLVSAQSFERWFSPQALATMWPIPLATAAAVVVAWRSLSRLPGRLQDGDERGAWIPFASAVGLILLSFLGLAYSLFPYLVLDRLTIWEAAAAPESLMITFVGAVIVLPIIVGYSVFAYRVFWGKATDLEYG
jgi:cytochrome d ubiquinol oxidase subunit II